jgi:hypothetical protein
MLALLLSNMASHQRNGGGILKFEVHFQTKLVRMELRARWDKEVLQMLLVYHLWNQQILLGNN